MLYVMVSAGLLIFNPPHTHTTSKELALYSDVVPIDAYIEFEDVPEISDGKRTFVFAALITYDASGLVDLSVDEIREIANIFEQRHYDYQGWRYYKSLVKYVSNEHYIEDVIDFFETLDSITTEEDRIVLILIGHGGVVNNTFYFSVCRWRSLDGTYVDEVISSLTLLNAIYIIGPALDFIWFVSCESLGFINDVGSLVPFYAGNVVIWGYSEDVHVDDAQEDLRKFGDFYEKDNPSVEWIWYLIKSCPKSWNCILVQYDQYNLMLPDLMERDLHLLSYRPADYEKSTAYGGGSSYPGGGYLFVSPT